MKRLDPFFIGSILHSQWDFAGAKLRFRFQPCFYETRNPGIKRLSINFCRHSFISSIGRYTCFTMPNLRLHRLPFAASQKPNFSLIPYLILVSYRTILTFHIKSYQITSKSSRHCHLTSHHLPPISYKLSPTFTTFSTNHSRVKKSPFPCLGTKNFPKVLSQNSCTKLGAEDWTQISQGPGWAPLIRSRGMRMSPLKLWPKGRGYEHPKICQLMVGVIVFFFFVFLECQKAAGFFREPRIPVFQILRFFRLEN